MYMLYVHDIHNKVFYVLMMIKRFDPVSKYIFFKAFLCCHHDHVNFRQLWCVNGEERIQSLKMKTILPIFGLAVAILTELSKIAPYPLIGKVV